MFTIALFVAAFTGVLLSLLAVCHPPAFRAAEELVKPVWTRPVELLLSHSCAYEPDLTARITPLWL